MPVNFVGHPLVDLAVPPRDRRVWLPTLGFDASRPVVALLPGSRPNEVARILPDLVGAARLLHGQQPGVQFLVARAPSLDDALFAPLEALRASGAALAVVTAAADDVLAASDVVVTASGTATVQAALHGKPMVIVYRLSPMTYRLGRAFVRVPHYGMVNLVAERAVVPELIQDACTPEAVAAEVRSLLHDEVRAATMRRDLADVRERLGGAGASRRAAEAVIEVASRPRQATAAPDRLH